MILALAKNVCPSSRRLVEGFRRSAAKMSLLAGALAVASMLPAVSTTAWSQESSQETSQDQSQDQSQQPMEGMAMSGVAPAQPDADAPAAQTVYCGGGKSLPASADDAKNYKDLVVMGGKCVVDGKASVTGTATDGIYVYRNVNILNGGTLSFSDATIDFHAHSILIENGGTLAAGDTSPITKKLTIYLWGGPSSADPQSTAIWGIAEPNPSITCRTETEPNLSPKPSGATVCGIPKAVWDSNPSMATGGKTANQASPCQLVSKTGAKDPFSPSSAYALAGGDDCFYQYEVLDQRAASYDGSTPGWSDVAGAYFGRKALAVSAGGNLMLRGAKGIRTTNDCGKEASVAGTMEKCPADSGQSWVRLTTDISSSQRATSFYVDRDVPTWGPGDHIVLTTTDFLPSHSEELVIASVAKDANGTKITVTTPTQYPHVGTAYDFSAAKGSNVNPCADATKTVSGPCADQELANLTNIPAAKKLDLTKQVETRAIVALLTRNIVIASEGIVPTVPRADDHFPSSGNSFRGGAYYGGHVIARQGVKTFNVQGVEFYQLGQGGLIGRYPVHFHMDRKVPQPSGCTTDAATGNLTCTFQGTYLADSSIVDSMTRFVTIHATQGVTLARNVGYKSIGQGFYLEDATETNNRLYSNVGINARAGIADPAVNPRLVPGILNSPQQMLTDPGSGRQTPVNLPVGAQMPDDFPFHSDVNNPSVFWIQNTWNDIQYNAAVGAGTCGACYWFPPAAISGPSLNESWTGYASQQIQGSGEGTVPVYNFRGNYCSAAMFALQTVGSTNQCNRLMVGDGSPTQPADLSLKSVPNKAAPSLAKFPYEVGQRNHATVCSNQNGDCSKIKFCSGDGAANEINCAPTVVDRFTTSFNWAPVNFSAVWMRGWWQMVQNSAVTDQLHGGITFISGGGFTRSDAAQGFWSILKNSVLVGNTQKLVGADKQGADMPDNAAASVAGPFNPDSGLTCPRLEVDACTSYNDGIIIVNSSTGDFEHLYNIYDGPAAQFNNIYADIHAMRLGIDEFNNGRQNPSTQCATNDSSSNCQNLGFVPAYNNGNVMRKNIDKTHDYCYLPNAAIGWKQPNGFYYPPAFHSKNLIFSDVDIRHFVIQPLLKPYSTVSYYQQNNDFTDPTSVPLNYCGWAFNQFNNFSDIDRETELSDDDGTLTGLTSSTVSTSQQGGGASTTGPSVSVTKAAFNNAPINIDECSSGQYQPDPNGAPISPIANGTGQATVNTSPYEYLTLAITRGAATNTPDPSQPGNINTSNWNADCGNGRCYGVPLFRQYMTDAELTDYKNNLPPNSDPSQPSFVPTYDPTQFVFHYPVIRAAGGGNGARSALMMNHASYYIDTSVSAVYQDASNQDKLNQPFRNVFEAGQSYNFFLIFGKATTHQTYSLYIGKQDGFSLAQAKNIIKPIRVGLGSSQFPVKVVDSGNWINVTAYDANTGIVTLTIDLQSQTDFQQQNLQPYCQPTSYCQWKSNSCVCKPGTACDTDAVCALSTGDIDCPVNGCFGFQVTMPSFFPNLTYGNAAAQKPIKPIAPISFTNPDNPDAWYFKKGNVTFVAPDPTKVKVGECAYPPSQVPTQTDETIMEKPEPWRLTPEHPVQIQVPTQNQDQNQ